MCCGVVRDAVGFKKFPIEQSDLRIPSKTQLASGSRCVGWSYIPRCDVILCVVGGWEMRWALKSFRSSNPIRASRRKLEFFDGMSRSDCSIDEVGIEKALFQQPDSAFDRKPAFSIHVSDCIKIIMHGTGRIEKVHFRSTIYSTGCVWIPSLSSVGSSW